MRLSPLIPAAAKSAGASDEQIDVGLRLAFLALAVKTWRASAPESQLNANAKAKLAEFVDVLKNNRMSPATAVVVYDVRTGAMVVAVSGTPPSTVAPDLLANVQKLGAIGTRVNGNTLGACSEFRGGNQLLLEGSKLSDLRWTDAIRPRTGSVKPPCTNCQNTLGPNVKK
jgi:filamentous hemagglutinin